MEPDLSSELMTRVPLLAAINLGLVLLLSVCMDTRSGGIVY